MQTRRRRPGELPPDNSISQGDLSDEPALSLGSIRSSAVACPPPVIPSPAFVALSAASQLATENHRLRQQDLQDDAVSSSFDLQSAALSHDALALINNLLDQLLYNFLFLARSTTLSALRPAVASTLKGKLARHATATAEQELHDLLAEGEEEGDLDHGQASAKSTSHWPLDTVWKRTRLRIMVYTRLGEMEDEEEEYHVEQDQLYEHDGGVALVTWAAAIYLTAILEFVAEQCIAISGQAACERHFLKTQGIHTSNSTNGASDEDGLTVEECDVERLALNPLLGRTWRTFRKHLRMSHTSPILASESTDSRPREPSTPTQSRSPLADAEQTPKRNGDRLVTKANAVRVAKGEATSRTATTSAQDSQSGLTPTTPGSEYALSVASYAGAGHVTTWTEPAPQASLPQSRGLGLNGRTMSSQQGENTSVSVPTGTYLNYRAQSNIIPHSEPVRASVDAGLFAQDARRPISSRGSLNSHPVNTYATPYGNVDSLNGIVQPGQAITTPFPYAQPSPPSALPACDEGSHSSASRPTSGSKLQQQGPSGVSGPSSITSSDPALLEASTSVMPPYSKAKLRQIDDVALHHGNNSANRTAAPGTQMTHPSLLPSSAPIATSPSNDVTNQPVRRARQSAKSEVSTSSAVDSNSAVTPKDDERMIVVSRTRATPTRCSERKGTSRSTSAPVARSKKPRMKAREARAQPESTHDFAEFIRDTAPEREQQVVPLLLHSRNVTSPGTTSQARATQPPTKTTRKSVEVPSGSGALASRLVSPPKTAKPAMQPRGPTVNEGRNEELIAFIRQGPPGLQSDSQATSVTMSNAGMLAEPSSDETTPRLQQVSDAPSMATPDPIKKRSRIRDPYALPDSDDEEDNINALPRNEESLMDFLNNVAPPSQTSRRAQAISSPPSAISSPYTNGISSHLTEATRSPSPSQKRAGSQLRSSMPPDIHVTNPTFAKADFHTPSRQGLKALGLEETPQMSGIKATYTPQDNGGIDFTNPPAQSGTATAAAQSPKSQMTVNAPTTGKTEKKAFWKNMF